MATTAGLRADANGVGRNLLNDDVSSPGYNSLQPEQYSLNTRVTIFFPSWRILEVIDKLLRFLKRASFRASNTIKEACLKRCDANPADMIAAGARYLTLYVKTCFLLATLTHLL